MAAVKFCHLWKTTVYLFNCVQTIELFKGSQPDKTNVKFQI